MGGWCAVGGCYNLSAKKIPGVSFHRFPAAAERRKIWINFVRLKRANFVDKRNSVICSQHFDKKNAFCHLSNLKKMMGYSQVLLTDTAIPSITNPEEIFCKKTSHQCKANTRTCFWNITDHTYANFHSTQDYDLVNETAKDTLKENEANQCLIEQPDEKSRTELRVKKRRKKRPLSMHGGKSKLERNPMKVSCEDEESGRETKRVVSPMETWILENPIKIEEPFPITPERKRKRKSDLSYVKKIGPATLSVKIEPSDWSVDESIETEVNRSGSTCLKKSQNSEDYPKNILSTLYDMQKNSKLCDLSIIVNSAKTRRKVVLKVHKLIFAVISNKIKAHRKDVFQADEKINMNDVMKIIEFAYTGEIQNIDDLSQAEIKQIFYAALSFDMTKCLDYLEPYRRDDSSELPFKMDESVRKNNENCNGLENFQPPDIDEYFPFDLFDNSFAENATAGNCAEDPETTDTSGDEASL